MPAVLAQRIIREVAAASADPLTKRELVRRLRLSDTDEDRHLFKSAMASLIESSKIEAGSDGRFRLPPMPDEVEGVFRLNRRGFGFVICDTASQEGDL
ncbi:MAG: hypothetical protein P8L37_02355, partial [Phycisphaerales bacterium]|nr:hypothetical protein [Phycisphaerales bacterium]